MVIWKVITALFVTVLPLVVIYRDFQFHDRRTKAFRRITFVLLCLLFLAGVSSAVIAWLEIKDLYSYRIEQESWTTGGRQFPFIIADTSVAQPNIVVFRLVNDDTYPVFNVSARMFNLTQINAEIESRVLGGTGMPGGFEVKDLEIGTVNPVTFKEVARLDIADLPGKFSPPENGEYHFLFALTSLTASSSQEVYVMRQGDKFVSKSSIRYGIKHGLPMVMQRSSVDFADKKAWDFDRKPISEMDSDPISLSK